MTMNFSEFSSGVSVPNSSPVVVPVRQTKVGAGFYRTFGKRAIDIALIVLAAPIVLPLMIVLVLIVAREGGKPFYTQQRVGLGGRPFRMWKLRTMIHDADARMTEHLASNADARKEWDETQKLRNDPRITSVGRFLRRSSLDELPQLWNVLRGEMTLVGPRPMMLCQREMYPCDAYYRMRPGITGYWQTAGRNKTTFEARAIYDAAYEKDISFKTDLKVMIDTVGVVANCTGY